MICGIGVGEKIMNHCRGFAGDCICVFICCLCLEVRRDMFLFQIFSFQNKVCSVADDKMV